MTADQVIELRSLLKYSISLKFSSVFSKNLVFGLLVGVVLTYARRNSITDIAELAWSILVIGAVVSVAGYLSFRSWLELDAGPLLIREAIQKDLLEQQVKVVIGTYNAQLSHPISGKKNIYRLTFRNKNLSSSQSYTITETFVSKYAYVSLDKFLSGLPPTQQLRCYYAANSYVLQSIELVNDN